MNKTKLFAALCCTAMLFAACEKNEPKEANYQAGTKNGVFSVSPSRTVKFAPGNLQCTLSASDTTWSFAANQYDMIGTDNVTTDIGGNDVLATKIDLFGWSANNTTAPWGISTSTTSGDYSGDFVDWGKNIGNGNTWRTLTSAEWDYVFNTRTNASSLYGFATVNGTNGLILLPDSWALPSGLTFKSGIAAITNNEYTTAQWQQMESAGAVFLPAAGGSYGTTVSYVQSRGFYWSSTVYDTSGAYNLDFGASYLSPQYSYPRYDGHSVRLVQDL